MPVHVISPQGHHAVFFSRSARQEDGHLVSWGPSSISVPSDCSLNGPAHVWLYLPSASMQSAERWCSRVHAQYLGAWRTFSRITGFGFAVSSFSRYRYIDSDEEDSDAEPHQDDENQIESVDRREALTRKAGRTPARRRVPSSQQIAWTQDHQSPMQIEQKERISPATRPRMSAQVIVDLTDEEEEVKSEGEVLEKTSPQHDADTFDDPFRPLPQWQDSEFDYPKLHGMREALFETKQQSHRRLSDDPNMEDVSMSDVYSFYAPLGKPVEPDSDVEEASKVVSDILPLSRPALPSMHESCSAGSEHIFVDNGLCLGRSTRMSFNSKFVFNQKYHYSPYSFDENCFGIEATPLHSPSSPQRSVLALVLRAQFAAWNGYQETIESSSLRRPSLNDPFDIPNVFDDTLRQITNDLDDGLKNHGDENFRHALVVFSLLFALYKSAGKGYIDGVDNLMQRLAKWAEGPVRTAFDDPDLEITPMRRAVIDLCLGAVEQAVDTAIEQGHLRLAMLMSRALEVPKDDLRDDAVDQLVAYRLVDPAVLEDNSPDLSVWDMVLEECSENSPVDINERLVLLVLAGHVDSVARYLGFSWYRLFVMELVHGAGNSEEPQPDRVAAAVSAINESDIATLAPHLNSESELDVAYHMLRLYADPTGKYPITSGVYSSCSFGFDYKPLDASFPWLLHQVLSAIIPEATTKAAPCVLADAFSTQLQSAGLPLWAFYTLCSGGAPVENLKAALIRDWKYLKVDAIEIMMERARMDPMEVESEDDKGKTDENLEVEEARIRKPLYLKRMTSLQFLQDVLKVPSAWIAEAEALAAREEGDVLKECKLWLECNSEEGSTNAHSLLTESIMPEVIVGEDFSRYESCVSMLRILGTRKHISNWLHGGGLLLDYMEQVMGTPHEKPKADLAVLHRMVERLTVFKEKAISDVQRQCVRIIADGVATAQRAVLLSLNTTSRDEALANVIDDIGRLPLSICVKSRLTDEYTAEEEKGRAASTRLSGAFPGYGKYIAVDE
eukprot:TRINITY_DN3476_c0_g1_i1.p1 TRINITY_DN3476_c0_g1~~TRINITY_DN3476_c0_g1_i1.p1  ORF type:complete len:1012 (+),score=130.19 TRINITY_DN3476_c0_g1_i1:199-3234(+)